MTAGSWYNYDGLLLQYGTQKAIPEVGGDFLIYGETREIEQYIALVPTTWGNGNVQLGGAPTSFSGTGTPIQAGIQSMTTFVPLQLTALQTTSGSVLSLTNPQLFFEQVDVETLQGATGGTSIAVGLVGTQPGVTANSTFVQIAPNAGVQIINGLLIANMATPGMRASFWTPTATTGIIFGGTAPGTPIAGSGAWMGNVPLVTTSFTTPQGGQTIPQSAWISTIATGAFTAGLLKLRLRYTLYGTINF
jgi:hypothetical protein